MATIVDLINERAAQIMEQAGTTEKVINVKNISKSEAIEMAIEQLVKEGLIKAPTMTAAERRERLAKARRKTGVFTPNQEPPKAETKQEPTAKVEPEAKTETKPEPKEEVQSRRATAKPQAKPRKAATEITTADLYKFTGDDRWRPLFNGIHYAEGHAEATDAHILIRVPFNYSEEMEDTTISKMGNKIDGVFPKTYRIIPDIAEGNKFGYKLYKFDAEKVLQQCKDLITLNKALGIGSHDSIIQIYGVNFDPNYMKQIAEMCLKYGGDDIYIADKYRCCVVPILGGVMILMPVIDEREIYIDSEKNQIFKGPRYSFKTSIRYYLEDNLKTSKQSAEMYQKADMEKEYKKDLSDVKRRSAGIEVLDRYPTIRTAPKKRTGAVAAARPEKSRLQNLKLFRVPKATEEEQKHFRRRERLASIRAKRGATAKGKVNLTGVHRAKAETTNTKSGDDKTSWDGNDLQLILMHEKLKNPLNLYITPITIKNKTIYNLDIYSKYGENGLGINIVMNSIIDSVKHTQEIVLRKDYKPIRYRIEAHLLDKKQMSEILDDLLDVFKNLNIEISSDNPKPVSEKTLKRREKLASIRAKRGATAKGKVNPTGVHRAKAKDTAADLDFLPANLRGKKIPIQFRDEDGDYDDFARKVMKKDKIDPWIFIMDYTNRPGIYDFGQSYPDIQKDLMEIIRLVYAHKLGWEIDGEGNVITNVVDVNGKRVRENDWVKVSGSWSDAENRLYKVKPLYESDLHSQLLQFWLTPINQDGTESKSTSIARWPMWESHHSKLEDRIAYNKHNKENLKIEVVPNAPKEKKVTERYTATKDGIYMPDKTYVKVYYSGGEKDGDPVYVGASSYGSQLYFLASKDDRVKNDTDSQTDYFDTDSINVTKTNPKYDLVRLGALKAKLDRLGYSERNNLKYEQRRAKQLQATFDETKSASASIALLEANKAVKAAEKALDDKMKEADGLKKEIARLDRKLKGESKPEKKIVEKVDIEETVYTKPDEKTLKRRERLAAIRAKQGATKATKPKGTPRKPKAANEPDEKTIARRERLAAIRARAGARKAESAKGRTFKRVAPAAEPQMSHDERVRQIIASNPISETAARDAKRMYSFSEYEEGSASRDYADGINEIAKNIKRWPEERHEEFYKLLRRYARNLATYINADNAIGSRVPSVMISGAGNFPVRKKQKQIAAWDRNHNYYNDKVEPLISRLEHPSFQGIKSSDENAVGKLQAKLDRMEKNQELMKRANADFAKALKEKKTVGQFLEQVSYLSDDMRKDAMFNIQSWHGKPFPPYALQNANQEMRRLKQRIADISKVKEEGSGEVEKYKNDHFTVERDTDIMRYKLIFDGVPAKEVRAVIKKNGAHWSPHYVAWLLPLTGTSGYKIESIIQELDKMNN